MPLKYVPETLLTHDRGYGRVIRIEADGEPSTLGYYNVTCYLDNGRKRTFGSLTRPYIDATLRMVMDVNPRDEVRMQWEDVTP